MMLSVERRRRSAAVMCLAAVFLTVSMAGCTTLRRKFVRKSKSSDSKEDVVPVLQPEEYAPRVYAPVERYREHYAMLKGYFSDLWSSLGRDGNVKRERYLLSQIVARMDSMAALLPEMQKVDLQKLESRVQGEMEVLDKPFSLRRYDVVSGELKAVERDLRRNFKPDMVDKLLK
ncbi:MAG: hypothetical protein HGA80_00180 [Candidatus Omnitrophica bacterium]|nr:hypothetical protein [Candidatus Omnitrophota bacterium]